MLKLLFLQVLLATSPAPSAAAAHPDTAWVERTLAGLELRERVAQMVTPWIPGGLPAAGGAEWRRARELVAEQRVGGLIVGKGSAAGTAQFLNLLQRSAAVPLLVAADLEWGAGTRFEEATTLPVNMALAAAGDAALAREAGRITALEARAVGVHMAFAPVADVNVNPANPVINTRSYGADPAAVAEHVAAFIEGARKGGLLTVAKHFPGHGDTDRDSHLALPLLGLVRARLDSVELPPFRAAVATGAAGIMTAHLAVPALEPDGARDRPATLSPALVTGLLRGELGYRGLVVTDALNMDGAHVEGEPGAAAVRAVQAGADMLLMPSDVAEAIDALVAAVNAGVIAPERIDASVRRVLAAKAAAGLPGAALVDLAALPALLGGAAHAAWAQQAAERSITLVRRGEMRLPLRLSPHRPRRVVSIVYDDSRSRRLGEHFDAELERAGAVVRSVRLWRRSRPAELREAERAAGGADVVVFSSYVRAVPWKGTLALPAEVAALADRLAAAGAVVVSFGDPYLLDQIPAAQTYLLAWSDAEVAERAAARALTGRSAVTGRLPTPLPPHHLLGHGIAVPARAGVLGRSAER